MRVTPFKDMLYCGISMLWQDDGISDAKTFINY